MRLHLFAIFAIFALFALFAVKISLITSVLYHEGLQSYLTFIQVYSVSERESANEKSRRWGAFVCPDCRFVFRVPGDHDGVGIVCPSCRRMLRIPVDGDAVAPLMAPIKKIGG